MLDQIGNWAVSIAGLLVYAIVAAWLVTWYFRKAAGYDAVTSYFASSPGGLNEMVIVGREMGGDDRVIALTHSARILLVVMTLPFLFQMFTDYTPAPGLLPQGGALDMPLLDWVVLAACAVVGSVVAKRLRIPAAVLIGPMLLSAAVHVTGITQATLPSVLVATAQVVLGTGIGCRFAGTPCATSCGSSASRSARRSSCWCSACCSAWRSSRSPRCRGSCWFWPTRPADWPR